VKLYLALKIKLRRIGANKQPYYRLVVADARTAVRGKFVENIGNYTPITDPMTLVVNEERALYWLSKGAQPTKTVHKLLVKAGVWSKFLELKNRSKEEACSEGV